MNRVICIGREFGSGGREMGRRLADELGFAYYDKEVIDEIVEKTPFSEEYVKNIVEGKRQQLYPINERSSIAIADNYQIRQLQSIYTAQSDVIREMALKSDCVIVGRCADYILEDVEEIQIFKLFVYADLEARVKRCYERAPEDEKLTEKEMIKQINKIDKARASYYSNFTLRKWGDKKYYDFCINTTGVDIEAMVPHFAKIFTLPPKPKA